MKIRMTLKVDDSEADEADSTGMTVEAYDRLMRAVVGAGFEVHDVVAD